MIRSFFAALWKEEEGQDLVEYSLLLAFIALAAVGVLGNSQKAINTLWNTINKGLTNANTQAAS